MKRWLLAAIVVTGCGAPAPEPPPAPKAAAPPAPAASIPESPPPNTPASLPMPADAAVAVVRAVDLDGKPLAGMAPMVTTDQNAFNPPLAAGEPTGPDGRGAVPVPPGKHVFVRAWDPELRYFPNNVYSVHMQTGERSEEMTVQMIRSGTVAGAVFGPDGAPLANAEIRMMMVHPSQGPWWPARTLSDGDGIAVFERVPAGRYIVQIHDTAGRGKEYPEIEVQPEGITNLGRVALQ